jgi:L-fuculose-phosphate aldolase
MIRDVSVRREIIQTARRMNATGINQSTSGNVSARVGTGGFLITPSALAYDEMRPEDVVQVRLDGTSLGRRRASTEWRLHRDIYARRSDAGAIVHAHPMFATTLACLGREIPAVHYMVAMAGGATIRCAPYATFGTQELSDHAVAALDGRKACLLANHGMVAMGSTLADALDLVIEVETLAAIYWRTLQVGEPKILSDVEMARVLAKFEDYRAGSIVRPKGSRKTRS